MYVLTGGKVNPLIGSAGVSAVPMAARVSQVVGQKENPSNFLLMHAMGPNVAGVIGSAVCRWLYDQGLRRLIYKPIISFKQVRRHTGCSRWTAFFRAGPAMRAERNRGGSASQGRKHPGKTGRTGERSECEEKNKKIEKYYLPFSE